MSKGTNTVTQQADPWSGQQPYISDVFSQAQQQYNAGPMQFYPDRLTALPSQTQLDAEALGRLTALGGQSTLAGSLIPAQQFQLAGPQNLADNPYLASATEAALRPLFSQTQGLLQQARRGATSRGQLGSDRQAILEQGVIGDYLTKAGDITSKMYGDAYRDALTAQSRALAIAPQSLAALSIPSSALGQIGAMETAREQQAINDARARFEFGQAAPAENLARYSNLVASTILPGNTTSSSNMGSPGGLTPDATNLGLAGLTQAGLTYGLNMTAGAAAPWAAGAYILGSIFD